MLASSSFGAVVTMAQAGSSTFRAQMPANANSAPPFTRMCIGGFASWPGIVFYS
jgi:hypothetical protein